MSLLLVTQFICARHKPLATRVAVYIYILLNKHNIRRQQLALTISRNESDWIWADDKLSLAHHSYAIAQLQPVNMSSSAHKMDMTRHMRVHTTRHNTKINFKSAIKRLNDKKCAASNKTLAIYMCWIFITNLLDFIDASSPSLHTRTWLTHFFR